MTSAPAVTTDANSVKLGETFTWPDQLSISVSPPTPFTPPESVSVRPGEPGWTDLEFELRLVNGSDVPYDPGQTVFRLDSDGAKAPQFLDVELGIGIGRENVLPGDEIVYRVAFTVPDPDDMVFSFTPDSGHATAYITG